MRGFFLFLLFYAVCLGEIFAQTEHHRPEKEIQYDESKIAPLHFDEEQITRYQQEEAFGYVQQETQENWWTRFKNWVGKIWAQFWNWLLGGYEAHGIVAFLLRLLPYLVLAAVLGFVLWLFIKLDPAGSTLKTPQKPGVLLSEEEKIIRHENISELIENALKTKNYRLAVRYYYLLVLKKMREKKLIDYQFQKTNEEYLAEIKPISLNEQFREITRIYDFVWYGDFPVSEPDFKKAESEFHKIQNALKNPALV